MKTTTETQTSRPAARLAVLLFGGLAYVGFHVAFLSMISFINGGPTPFDAPFEMASSIAWEIAFDLALVALFGIQHAIMARPAFKRAWCRVIPESIERSVFVLATVVCLGIAIAFWQSIPGVLFNIQSEVARYALFAIQALGWATVVFSTFLIDHFELFGLRQVWSAFRGTELPEQRFRQPLLYRYSRHPMMVGMFMGLWATPDMTFDRFLWASGFTAYILIGTRLEERDLVSVLGADYEHYQRTVPRFIGRVRNGSRARAAFAKATLAIAMLGLLAAPRMAAAQSNRTGFSPDITVAFGGLMFSDDQVAMGPALELDGGIDAAAFAMAEGRVFV